MLKTSPLELAVLVAVLAIPTLFLFPRYHAVKSNYKAAAKRVDALNSFLANHPAGKPISPAEFHQFALRYQQEFPEIVRSPIGEILRDTEKSGPLEIRVSVLEEKIEGLRAQVGSLEKGQLSWWFLHLVLPFFAWLGAKFFEPTIGELGVRFKKKALRKF